MTQAEQDQGTAVPLCTILVASADPARQQALAGPLQQAGYLVLRARSGADALELAGEGLSLMLLERDLPDQTSFDVSRQLRAQPATAHLPIIHLAPSFTQTATSPFSQPHDAYLTLPVEELVLLSLVNALLRAAAEGGPGGTSSPTNPASFVSTLHRRLLEEISQIALQELDLDAVLHSMVRRLAHLLAADRASIELWHEESGHLVPAASFGFGGVEFLSRPSQPGERTMSTSVLEAAEVLIAEDVFQSPYITPFLANQYGAHTLLGLPLIARGQKLGVVLVGFVKPHHFSPSEIAWGQQAVRLVALALQNVRLLSETRRHAREMTLLNQVIGAAAATRGVDEVLHRGCEALAQFFDLPQVRLGLLDEQRESITIVAEYLAGGRDSAMGLKIPVKGNAFQEEVFATGAPLAVADIKSHPAALGVRDLLLRQGIRSMLIVPISVRGTVVGTAGIDSAEPRLFTEQEIRLARTVGEELGRALETARLNSQLRTYTEELEQRVAERTQALEQANARLKELDQLKSRFISQVSHELRTPITNIGMYLELLERGKPEKQGRYRMVLKKEAARLGQLVEDILRLSRLEMSEMREMKFGPLDLNELVRKVIKEHRDHVNMADLSLTFEPATNLPAVWGEGGQLVQLVSSLLSNAINYTKEGTIWVSTYWAPRHQQLCLQVEDTGPGIPAEDLPHVFERFYRGRAVSEMDIPGTGLGLAIVKEIVDMHGGSIEVHSEVGAGTKVQVFLPSHIEMSTGRLNAGETLLVVDDSEVMRQAVLETLTGEGYQVIIARHGQEALEQMAATRPDLVVTDLNMPTMDGTALYQAVRRQPEWANIPFLFVTGDNSPELDELLASGVSAQDLLFKPITMEELARAVRHRLRRERQSPPP